MLHFYGKLGFICYFSSYYRKHISNKNFKTFAYKISLEVNYMLVSLFYLLYDGKFHEECDGVTRGPSLGDILANVVLKTFG